MPADPWSRQLTVKHNAIIWSSYNQDLCFDFKVFFISRLSNYFTLLYKYEICKNIFLSMTIVYYKLKFIILCIFHNLTFYLLKNLICNSYQYELQLTITVYISSFIFLYILYTTLIFLLICCFYMGLNSKCKTRNLLFLTKHSKPEF